MALGDNAYSRLISAAKVILPIIALGILSLLFVVSRPGREGEPPRFVDLDLEELAKDEHLARPDYRSVTETGSILQLEAVELRPVPGQDSAYSGTQLSGQIDRTDGVSYTMTSNSGRLDEIAGVAWMTGDVRLRRDDGHTAISEEIEIATDLSLLVSPGPVHAFGPLGTLDADSMEMRGQPDLGSGAVTVFTGNVRLLYDPKKDDGEPK
ncbi:MAG: hypothetical protein NXH97_19965 [Rhodobacteraceae bacterium]|nr:hypothetical protein [Paracoccaceae bacterium]